MLSNCSVINENFVISSLSSKTGDVELTAGMRVKPTISAVAMVKKNDDRVVKKGQRRMN